MDPFAWIFNIAEDLGRPRRSCSAWPKRRCRNRAYACGSGHEHFDRDLALVKEAYNQAWEKNWGFVPMTEREMDHLAAGLKPMIDPNLIFIAETADGKPAGVVDPARPAPGAQTVGRRTHVPLRAAQVPLAPAQDRPDAAT